VVKQSVFTQQVFQFWEVVDRDIARFFDLVGDLIENDLDRDLSRACEKLARALHVDSEKRFPAFAVFVFGFVDNASETDEIAKASVFIFSKEVFDFPSLEGVAPALSAPPINAIERIDESSVQRDEAIFDIGVASWASSHVVAKIGV